MFGRNKIPKMFVLFVAAVILIFSINVSSIFAATDTRVQDFVTRFYRYCLDREPDQAGLDNWVSQLVSKKVTGAQVASGFIFSAEFTAKNTSNEEFLEVLYRAFFNREPDEGGFNNWLNLLNTGNTRQFVLAGFINSQEFKDLCASFGINPGTLDPGAAMPVVQVADTSIPILAMHGVEPNASGKYELSSGAFEYLLSTLKSYGYQTVTFMDLLAYMDAGKKLPAKPVIISMDDGYQNIYTNAFPLAKKYGYKLTVFLVTGLIGDTEAQRRLNDFDAGVAGIPQRAMMIWPEIVAMSRAGMEFQSHGWSHRILTDISLEEAKMEMTQSKSDIEVKLGKPCVFIAWPHDATSGEIMSLLPQTGYRGGVRAYGGIEDLKTINFYNILRINIDATMDPASFAGYIGLR